MSDVFSNPAATSFAAPKPSKWQVAKDIGIVAVVGAAVFFAGGITGSIYTEHSHDGEFSIAIAEIRKENDEEAQRFEELTNICKNPQHARLSCRSSIRDLNAKRISTVQQPPAQRPAATEDDNRGIVQNPGSAGST